MKTRLRTILLILLVFGANFPEPLRAQDLLQAAHQAAAPINQRRANINACGPASLLNAFQYGDKKWRKAYIAVPGTNSRSRINSVIAIWGNLPSNHIQGMQRWNAQQGINLLDLTDMANEMRAPHFLPKIKNEILTLRSDEPKTKLLLRSHARMARSMKKGLPPIISIRRYAYRYEDSLGSKSWWPIRAHFVVVIEVPKKLPKGAESFQIRYADPYGGHTRTGHINAVTGVFTNSPFLIADFPHTSVGGQLIKPGEKSELSLTAIIGRW